MARRCITNSDSRFLNSVGWDVHVETWKQKSGDIMYIGVLLQILDLIECHVLFLLLFLFVFYYSSVASSQLLLPPFNTSTDADACREVG